MKTVLIGEEIIFSAHVAFIDFSIRFQRYKERKVPGNGLKVMTISSTEGHERALFSKFCTWPIFDVCFHTFPIQILKCCLHEKCSYACLYSCIKIWASFIKHHWKYALKSEHCSNSEVDSFYWNVVLHFRCFLSHGIFVILFLNLCFVIHIVYMCHCSIVVSIVHMC